LIDQIVDFREGEYVHAIKYVDEKESYFQGHFPGNPVLPGVLIVECMAQASCFLSLSTVDKPDQKLMLLSVIRSAKFFKKVVPGDILSLEITLLKFRMNNALIKGTGTVNGEKVAEAEWMATVVDK
jgi:3-hydroxyacyl-[acyl-carrier-protein] dehydratase